MLGACYMVWILGISELLYNFEFLFQIDALVLGIVLLPGGQLGAHFGNGQRQIQTAGTIRACRWRCGHGAAIAIAHDICGAIGGGAGGVVGGGGAAAVDAAIVVHAGHRG